MRKHMQRSIDCGKKIGSTVKWLGSCTRASQIAEFAIGLPFLMVLLVGIFDFGQVFNTKQKINNAAREAARYASNQTTLDWTAGQNAPSIAATRAVVDSYLTNANLVDCNLLNSTPSFNRDTLTWTYVTFRTPCDGNSGHPLKLVIQRAYTFNDNGITLISTKVSISYPLQWHFASVMKVLLRGSRYAHPIITVSSDAVMANMT